MSDYYFLGASFPRLNFGVPPDLDFQELEHLYKENLMPSDYKKVETMRLYFDLLNLRARWTSQEVDSRGNLSENDLKEAILDQTCLPEYVFDFLHKYEEKKERIAHFAELIAAYFTHEIKNADGFLALYLQFERIWRLILTALRAKELKWDLYKELQYEDPNDELIAQMIAQKDAKTYDPPASFEPLKTLYHEYKDNPLELERALSEYRFEAIREMVGTDQFSIERILGFFAEFLIVQKWIELDKNAGMEKVDNLMKEAS